MVGLSDIKVGLGVGGAWKKVVLGCSGSSTLWAGMAILGLNWH